MPRAAGRSFASRLRDLFRSAGTQPPADRGREDRDALELLRATAARIEDFYNNAPCGYHSLDGEGRYLQINDTELRWLGYAREEIVGKVRFPDLITAASRAVFEENFPRFKERGWVSDLEMELVRRDGTLLPVLVSATASRTRPGASWRAAPPCSI